MVSGTCGLHVAMELTSVYAREGNTVGNMEVYGGQLGLIDAGSR